MPAPLSPAQTEIDLDPDDLVPEPEERTTSQTRRLGSNAQASIELDIKAGTRPVSMPDAVPLDEPSHGAFTRHTHPPETPKPPAQPVTRHTHPPETPKPPAQPVTRHTHPPETPKPPAQPVTRHTHPPETLNPPPQAIASAPAAHAPDEVPPEGGAADAAARAQLSGRPYLAGDVIDDKYRLTRIIGRGGMGAVWQAHNIPLDIDVAIKLIRRDRTAAGAADRLLTEARAAARLMHPAIVRVFDFGETDQRDPFIVMELLRGESLNAILRRKKRLSPAVAVQTLLPVAAALASAHGKGIVHRDLKPDNIIIVTDENGALVPKIVDFGIAKLLSPELDRGVTLAGEVLGSPDYMSPEQARGADNVGEATDIWAFSVVLYELVTGRRPFDGPNYNALIASILTDEPPRLAAHGISDAGLSGIIEHGLAKELPARWPRIRDMGSALASWAVAAGIEDDLMGNPIAKQWLSGAARRLLTVQPETGEPPLRSGPIAPPPGSVAAPTPGWAQPPPGPSPRLAASIGERRASAQRAVMLVVAIVLLGAAGVTAFVMRDRIAQLRGASVASASVDPGPTGSAPAAVPTIEPAPSASAAAAPPTASAEPAAPTASARVPGHLRFPRKTKAPTAPKNIKF